MGYGSKRSAKTFSHTQKPENLTPFFVENVAFIVTPTFEELVLTCASEHYL